MNPGGLVLVIAGVWVLTQVFGGHALERLNVVKAATTTTAPRGGATP